MLMLTPAHIRQLRKALEMTSMEFAIEMGVVQNTVWQWESGRRHPKWDHLVKLNALAAKAKQQKGIVLAG